MQHFRKQFQGTAFDGDVSICSTPPLHTPSAATLRRAYWYRQIPLRHLCCSHHSSSNACACRDAHLCPLRMRTQPETACCSDSTVADALLEDAAHLLAAGNVGKGLRLAIRPRVSFFASSRGCVHISATSPYATNPSLCHTTEIFSISAPTSPYATNSSLCHTTHRCLLGTCRTLSTTTMACHLL